MSEMIKVPDGWEVIEVGKLIKVTTGNKDTVNADSDGIYPFVIRSQDLLKINTYSFDGEAVLIAGDGDIRNIFHYFNGKFDFHQRVYCLHSFKKNLNGKYFYYFFRHNFVNQVNKYSAKGTVDSVRLEMITKMPMNVPPVKEQEKIAKILSTLDKSIEATNSLIEKEKNIKKALMQELLTNGIDQDGHIRTRATHTYKESELGLIPNEWEIVSLGKCIKNNGDYGINAAAVNLSYSLPTYLRITDIDGDGHFIEADKKSVDSPESGNFILNDGDIVFARTGNTTGKTYLYNSKDGKLVFAGFLIRFTPNQKKLIPHYLKATTETFSYWSWVETNSARTGQPGINANEYKSFKFKLPSIEEQKQIAKILTTQDKKIETEETNLAKLKELKKGLMNDLLSGKVRVNV